MAVFEKVVHGNLKDVNPKYRYAVRKKESIN